MYLYITRYIFYFIWCKIYTPWKVCMALVRAPAPCIAVSLYRFLVVADLLTGASVQFHKKSWSWSPQHKQTCFCCNLHVFCTFSLCFLPVYKSQCFLAVIRCIEQLFLSLQFISNHRRTGLEILGGGGRHEFCPTRAEGVRTSRGVRGHALQENFEK